ncbi:MAG: hypothetical protein Q9M91_05325 [Candidatus Dojkabacteria bacterium]|nr:hypothetical protein [Candidatus Dojkabacteria bacterium]
MTFILDESIDSEAKTVLDNLIFKEVDEELDTYESRMNKLFNSAFILSEIKEDDLAKVFYCNDNIKSNINVNYSSYKIISSLNSKSSVSEFEDLMEEDSWLLCRKNDSSSKIGRVYRKNNQFVYFTSSNSKKDLEISYTWDINDI